MQPSSDLTEKEATSRTFNAYLLQDYEEVLTQCARAIQLNPDEPMLWQIQAESFHNFGFYEAALHSYDQTLSLDAENAEAYFKAIQLPRLLQRLPGLSVRLNSSSPLDNVNQQQSLEMNFVKSLEVFGSEWHHLNIYITTKS